MKNIFCGVLFFLIMICNAKAEVHSVELKQVPCDGICLDLKYLNPKNYPICIKNSFFPYNGNLGANVLSVSDLGSGSEAEYVLTEPSFILGSKLAVLVRLVPPGGTANSYLEVEKLYNIDSNAQYKVSYKSVAYKCNEFGKDKAEILLKGTAILSNPVEKD